MTKSTPIQGQKNGNIEKRMGGMIEKDDSWIIKADRRDEKERSQRVSETSSCDGSRRRAPPWRLTGDVWDKENEENNRAVRK